jgi:hypothetical protein
MKRTHLVKCSTQATLQGQPFIQHIAQLVSQHARSRGIALLTLVGIATRVFASPCSRSAASAFRVVLFCCSAGIGKKYIA